MSAGPRIDAARAGPLRLDILRASMLIAALLCVASWAYLFVGEGARFTDLVSTEARAGASQFVRELLGRKPGLSGVERTPAFLEGARWREVLGLAVDTLAMSVLAAAIAAAGMLLTMVAAARSNDARPHTRARRVLRAAVSVLVRASYVVSRAVPELVWAMLVVFVLSPGVLAGAVALGIHNFGVLGRLGSEVIEDLDPRPARALRASGARGPQVLLYAVLPQALPQLLTSGLYRWEVSIRTTVVVGFVSAGGLGREFREAMSFFHYTDVALILLVYFGLVLAVDGAGAGLRRLAR